MSWAGASRTRHNFCRRSGGRRPLGLPHRDVWGADLRHLTRGEKRCQSPASITSVFPPWPRSVRLQAWCWCRWELLPWPAPHWGCRVHVQPLSWPLQPCVGSLQRVLNSVASGLVQRPGGRRGGHGLRDTRGPAGVRGLSRLLSFYVARRVRSRTSRIISAAS